MFADYHVHIDKMEWTMESMDDLCKSAKAAGVDTIGVVVHTKYLKGFESLYAHVLSDGKKHKKLKFHKDIDEYMKLLSSSKAAGYPVKIGIEVCYSPEGQSFLNKKLKKYPFDYTIGSVHLIGNMHFKTAVEYYGDKIDAGRMYYELILGAIQSRLFNIIGHIEVARREGIPGLDHYPDLLDDICNSLMDCNCAVEINTKWLTKHEYLVPEKDTLKYMAAKGVKLVFGSDAHHKERIGFAKDIAAMAIMDAGYRGFSTLV